MSGLNQAAPLDGVGAESWPVVQTTFGFSKGGKGSSTRSGQAFASLQRHFVGQRCRPRLPHHPPFGMVNSNPVIGDPGFRAAVAHVGRRPAY